MDGGGAGGGGSRSTGVFPPGVAGVTFGGATTFPSTVVGRGTVAGKVGIAGMVGMVSPVSTKPSLIPRELLMSPSYHASLDPPSGHSDPG